MKENSVDLEKANVVNDPSTVASITFDFLPDIEMAKSGKTIYLGRR